LACRDVSSWTTPQPRAHLTALKGLQSLDVPDHDGLTDDGTESIGQLLRLRTLLMRSCGVSDRGIACLHACTQLRFLDLRMCSISSSSIRVRGRVDRRVGRRGRREYGSQGELGVDNSA